MVKRRLNQKGQGSVEMVLILALSVAIFSATATLFRQKQYFAEFVSRPWANISSMIQNGVWSPNKVHPARYDRWATPEGDPL